MQEFWKNARQLAFGISVAEAISILAQTEQGDHYKAMAVLHREYEQSLANFIHRFVNDAKVKSEVSDEAFKRYYLQRKTISNESEFQSFLLRTCTIIFLERAYDKGMF